MSERPKSELDQKVGSAVTGLAAVERWNRAVREAHADTHAGSDARDGAARAVLEASDEEIERQLREAGIDLAAEDAAADATYEAVLAKHFPGAPGDRLAPEAEARDDDDRRPDVAWVATTETATVTHLPAKRKRATWIAWAVAAAAATGGAAYVAGHQPPPQREEPKPEVPTVHAPEPAPVAPTAGAPAPRPTPPSSGAGGKAGGKAPN